MEEKRRGAFRCGGKRGRSTKFGVDGRRAAAVWEIRLLAKNGVGKKGVAARPGARGRRSRALLPGTLISRKRREARKCCDRRPAGPSGEEERGRRRREGEAGEVVQRGLRRG